MLRIAVLALMAVIPLGCAPGNPAASCETSCPGCCQDGECKPGTHPTACGTAGGLCTICPAGFACNAAQCQAIPSDCVGCAGCCLGNSCHSGTSSAACGPPGGACQACPSGMSCVGGVCQKPWATCGPKTCSGCCQGDHCVKNPSDDQCGLGGAPCVPCNGGSQCNAGQCVLPGCAGCAAINGCCLNDTCYPGVSKLACGFGGGPCKQCKTSELCLAGQCKEGNITEKCELADCPVGCCAADGCHMPFNDQFCGIGANGCVRCGPGQICSGGKCVNRLTECQSKCPNGCCRGDSCIPLNGQGPMLCGNNGEPCRACYYNQCVQGSCGGGGQCVGCLPNQCCSGTTCHTVTNAKCGRQGSACTDCTKLQGCNFNTGQCNQAGAQRGSICAVAARINCADSGGSPACTKAVDSTPDIRVNLAIASKHGNTSSTDAEHDAQGLITVGWQNDCPISGLSASALSATPLAIQVLEVEPFLTTKLIDSCQVQLTATHVSTGTWTGKCGNYVESITLQLR